MAQSFVPEDTHVVCTMMTVTKPQQIKITQASNVNFKSKDKPLLTIGDNKISCSFACKAPASFWGGLQTLALGIAVGAAVVLTGGVAAGIILGACLASVAAGSIALWKIAHDCDATLDKKWMNPHNKVTFNKEKALLNRSYLQCPKGQGTLTIIMCPSLANEAAAYISSNNTDEVFIQMGSQFAMGFITSATAGWAAVAVGVSGAVTVGMYFVSDWIDKKELMDNTTSTVTTNVGETFISDFAQANIKANATQIKQVYGGAKLAAEGVAKNNPIYNGIGRAFMQKGVSEVQIQSAKKSIVQTTSKLVAEPGNLKNATKLFIEGVKEGNPIKEAFGKYAIGNNLSLAGLVANIGIGIWSGKVKNNLADEAEKKAHDLNEKDEAENNGISIMAKKV